MPILSWRQQIIDVVHGLSLDREKFILCGGSSIAMSSINNPFAHDDREHDLDLVVPGQYFRKLARRPEWHLETEHEEANPFGTRLVHCCSKIDVEVFFAWRLDEGRLLRFDELKRHTVSSAGICVIQPDQVELYKKILDREKDRSDIAAMRQLAFAC